MIMHSMLNFYHFNPLKYKMIWMDLCVPGIPGVMLSFGLPQSNFGKQSGDLEGESGALPTLCRVRVESRCLQLRILSDGGRST